MNRLSTGDYPRCLQPVVPCRHLFHKLHTAQALSRWLDFCDGLLSPIKDYEFNRIRGYKSCAHTYIWLIIFACIQINTGLPVPKFVTHISQTSKISTKTCVCLGQWTFPTWKWPTWTPQPSPSPPPPPPPPPTTTTTTHTHTHIHTHIRCSLIFAF